MRHAVTDQCKGDSICVEVCAKGVLEIADGRARTVSGREEHCILCGQCVAVCPQQALSLEGGSVGELLPRKDWGFGAEAFHDFLLSRRSTRVFADKPVERALVEQVIELASAAPPAFPPHTTEILVLDDQAEIAHFAKALREGYGKLLQITSNPVGRAIVRLRRGAQTAHALKTHVLAIARENNAWFERDGADRYLYGAPVVMLFHADRWAASHEESALVVATYAMLAAHALKLGATMLSIAPPIVNNLGKELRARWKLPDDNVVVSALILGHPKYKYRRTLKRPLKAVRFASS